MVDSQHANMSSWVNTKPTKGAGIIFFYVSSHTHPRQLLFTDYRLTWFTGYRLTWFTGYRLTWFTGYRLTWFTGYRLTWFTGYRLTWFTGYRLTWFTGYRLTWFTGYRLTWFTGYRLTWFTGYRLTWFTGYRLTWFTGYRLTWFTGYRLTWFTGYRLTWFTGYRLTWFTGYRLTWFTGYRLTWFTGYRLTWFTGYRLTWFTGYRLTWFTGYRLTWFTGYRLTWFTGYRLTWFTGYRLTWFWRRSSRRSRGKHSQRWMLQKGMMSTACKKKVRYSNSHRQQRVNMHAARNETLWCCFYVDEQSGNWQTSCSSQKGQYFTLKGKMKRKYVLRAQQKMEILGLPFEQPALQFYWPEATLNKPKVQSMVTWAMKIGKSTSPRLQVTVFFEPLYFTLVLCNGGQCI